MRKHIFASTLIFLTVGCQPNSSNTMRSQSETVVLKAKTGDKTNPHTSTEYSQGTTDSQESSDAQKTEIETSSTVKSEVISNISVLAYEAAVRMQMDIAGTQDPPEEMQLLDKLFTSKSGPAQVQVTAALKSNKISIKLEIKDLESTQDKDAEITALGIAFKQVAAAYGFPETEQNKIQKAIVKRASLLAPLASQKQMAAASGALMQEKANALIKSFATEKDTLCDSLTAFSSAADNFYSQEAQYTLPALIKRKGAMIKSFINEALTKCGSDIQGTRTSLGSNLPNAIDAMTFDLGSLELYLTPRNTFNWEEFENFKIKALLYETAEVRQAQNHSADGTMDASQLICQLNGKEIALSETSLKAEKQNQQRGVTVSFQAENTKVTYFYGITLTKIKPNILVPAINLIPGDKAKFQVSYQTQGDTATNTLICQVRNAE
ncbi:MAG: hypothetical protein J7501_08190 [Bdellovibrio sp.]|nr:hypothetical protein [Bdellovibrio sp.]